jgi:hypothetical protein
MDRILQRYPFKNTLFQLVRSTASLPQKKTYEKLNSNYVNFNIIERIINIYNIKSINYLRYIMLYILHDIDIVLYLLTVFSKNFV